MKLPGTDPALSRRSFIGLACGAPVFVGIEQGPGSSPGSPAPQGPVHALRTARRLGRPLLLLIDPERGPARRERARLWKEVFERCSDHFLVDVGMCAVLRTRMKKVRKELTREEYVVPEGEPLMLLVETDRLELHAIDPKLPEGKERDRTLARVAAVEHALHVRVALDLPMLERRALQVDSSPVHSRQRATVTRPHVDFVLRRLAAERSGTERNTRLAALAREVAAYVRTPPPPARPGPLPPGRYAGCGHGPCGSAHVPLPSRRFLDLYVED